MAKTEQRTGDSLTPADFEQRGVAVPFTTQMLFFSRLRRAPDKSLEYLVPGLTGGLETCVIPHGKIGDALSLSIFDRALMEELELIDDVSPAKVEWAALNIGISGLGGSRLMKNSRTRRQNDEIQRFRIQAQLINDVQQSAGQPMIDPEQLDNPEAATALEPVLSVAAAQTQIAANTIVTSSAQWAETLLTIGLPDAPGHAPYKKILDNMERFATELTQWLVPEPVGPAEMAQRIAVAARETVQVARRHIERIDSLRKSVEDTLRDWEKSWPLLYSDVTTVSYIVDGWPRLIDEWDKVGRMDRIDQREMVELFALYLPTLPQTKDGKNQEFWTTLKANQKRWNTMVGTPGLFSTDEKTRDKLAGFKVEAE